MVGSSAVLTLISPVLITFSTPGLFLLVLLSLGTFAFLKLLSLFGHRPNVHAMLLSACPMQICCCPKVWELIDCIWGREAHMEEGSSYVSLSDLQLITSLIWF